MDLKESACLDYFKCNNKMGAAMAPGFLNESTITISKENRKSKRHREIITGVPKIHLLTEWIVENGSSKTLRKKMFD